jgi:hypothetical protein
MVFFNIFGELSCWVFQKESFNRQAKEETLDEFQEILSGKIFTTI